MYNVNSLRYVWILCMVIWIHTGGNVVLMLVQVQKLGDVVPFIQGCSDSTLITPHNRQPQLLQLSLCLQVRTATRAELVYMFVVTTKLEVPPATKMFLSLQCKGL